MPTKHCLTRGGMSPPTPLSPVNDVAKANDSSSDDGMEIQHSPCQKPTILKEAEKPLTNLQEEEIVKWMRVHQLVYTP